MPLGKIKFQKTPKFVVYIYFTFNDMLNMLLVNFYTQIQLIIYNYVIIQ